MFRLVVMMIILELEATTLRRTGTAPALPHSNNRSMSTGGSSVRNVNTADIRKMVNAAQRKGSTQESRVAHHLPSSSHNMGPPPNIPFPRVPTFKLPTANGPSQSSGTPIGYSSAHAHHGAATTHWRSSAYAPGDRCQILMQVHYEIQPLKTLNSRPVGCFKTILSEGQGIPANSSGAQIAEITMSKMYAKLVMATTNGFVWDKSQMRVRDQQWNDLTDLKEEGHFGKSCFRQYGRDKKQIFSNPKTLFLTLLVIDKAHYEAYQDFDNALLEENEVAATKNRTAKSPRKARTKGRSQKKGKERQSVERTNCESDDDIDARAAKENHSDYLPKSPGLLPVNFTEYEPQIQGSIVNRKRARKDSEPLATDADPVSPPKNKRAHLYVSPDRQRLQAAMKHAGSIRNISSPLGPGERVEYSPIEVPEFHELVQGATWTYPSSLATEGTLHSTTQLGIGTFKTCHAGYLVLASGNALGNGLLGAKGKEDVAVKRVYLPSRAESSRRPEITRYGALDEHEKILMEANLLCWATSLLEFGYSFVDGELLKLKEIDISKSAVTPALKSRLHLLAALEATIPRLRFVRGGVAKYIGHDSIASSATRNRLSATSTTVTYLLEERIPTHAGFVKYINNGSAKPLANDKDDPDYKTSIFLCCMQHILYDKSGKQIYISDFQGGGNLLSDPQIMTPAEYGFGDGNVSSAFKAFSSQHICNDYCQLFGLSPLKA
ncbi:Eukaryotic elongation factor 2 kinase [Pleurotus pulmonarius]|nr:Eukaryotic elongation factor 2 kinase [Pleurotus pulmonarius]KAF4588918.1 Eukaryotic elongation factor 2 kinase [Pleurotus pulmonarius]